MSNDYEFLTDLLDRLADSIEAAPAGDTIERICRLQPEIERRVEALDLPGIVWIERGPWDDGIDAGWIQRLCVDSPAPPGSIIVHELQRFSTTHQRMHSGPPIDDDARRRYVNLFREWAWRIAAGAPASGRETDRRNDRVLTLEQAAEAMQCSEKTIERATSDGLPFFTVGNRRRVWKSDLIEHFTKKSAD